MHVDRHSFCRCEESPGNLALLGSLAGDSPSKSVEMRETFQKEREMAQALPIFHLEFEIEPCEAENIPKPCIFPA